MKLKPDVIEDLKRRAVSSYYRNAKGRGFTPQQPSEIEVDETFMGNPVVIARLYLGNSTGRLAEFDVREPQTWHRSQKPFLRIKKLGGVAV